MLAAKGLLSTAISVEIYKGRVQLSGFVDNKDQIAQAAKVVSAVPGVKLLQNKPATKSLQAVLRRG